MYRRIKNKILKPRFQKQRLYLGCSDIGIVKDHNTITMFNDNIYKNRGRRTNIYVQQINILKNGIFMRTHFSQLFMVNSESFFMFLFRHPT